MTGIASTVVGDSTVICVSWCRYLAFDGFTSTFQDKLFKGYNMSTYNQMLYVNAFSSLVSLCGMRGPFSAT